MSFLLQAKNIVPINKYSKTVVRQVLLQRYNDRRDKLLQARKMCHIAPKEDYIPFENLIQLRRKEARRSVLVQVNSQSSFAELWKYCSGFGNVKGIHHYTLGSGQNHFMLVEFNKEQSVDDLLSNGVSFSNDTDVIRVSSPLLWFRTATINSGKGRTKISTDDTDLITVNGLDPMPIGTLMLNLQSCSSVSEQISLLHKTTVLNDLGIRLRFMVARQIETAMSSINMNATVWPFGSSVNGFGKMGCDLDMVFRMSDDTKVFNQSNRLVFHTKKSLVSSRLQQQRYIELISDILQLYLPGCNHVRRILQARVPIVKYNQEYTGLECDLSMSNMTGVYMSELLYLYGSLDGRVRPLVFAVRKWAESVGLTNANPGKWITNFPLALMVLYFLQQDTREGAVLPPMKKLTQAARTCDIRITEDQINCTFLRDVSRLKLKQNNTESLAFVLLQFFEFYSTFDFNGQAISIVEGKPVAKMDYSPLFVVNPLEMSLNVTKNVSFEECERLKLEIRNAAWTLEGEVHKTDPDGVNPWGICPLFKPRLPNSVANLVKIGNMQRLVTVSDLFNNNELTENTANQSDKDSERPSEKDDQSRGQLKKEADKNNIVNIGKRTHNKDSKIAPNFEEKIKNRIGKR